MGVVVCGQNIPAGTYYCVYYLLDGSCQAYVQADEGVYIETNFQLDEFCPQDNNCNPQGTSQNWYTFKKLADGLQAIRKALGTVVITNGGGWRSRECAGLLNCDVHMYGLAADIFVSGGTFTQVATQAHDAGFVRIEVMKPSETSYNELMSKAGGGHIHVDVWDPNSTLYNQNLSNCSIVPAYPWYAAGIEGQSPSVNYSTWDQLLSYLQAN